MTDSLDTKIDQYADVLPTQSLSFVLSKKKQNRPDQKNLENMVVQFNDRR